VKSQYWKECGRKQHYPEPEESASYKSQEGTLNEEPVSDHPGVQIDCGALAAHRARACDHHDKTDGLTQVRHRPYLPDADIQLRAFKAVAAPTELETAQQWNQVLPHCSSAIYRNQRNNPVKPDQQERDSERRLGLCR